MFLKSFYIGMNHLKIDPHLFAAFAASESACVVLDFLPSSDLVETLRNLIYIQHDLFVHLLDARHYGSNNLRDFIDYTHEVKDEIKRLRNAD